MVRNFGSILIEYSKIVPDGIVAFFPSYLYMESIVAAWNDMVGGLSGFINLILSIYQGILNEVWKHKLIFVETPDANETSIALENYRRVCKGLTIYSTLKDHLTGLRQRSWSCAFVCCTRKSVGGN